MVLAFCELTPAGLLSSPQGAAAALPGYLQSTVRELERRGRRCGRALVACLAARRVYLPWVDLEPLAAGCAAHLAGDGEAVDAATRRFVAPAPALSPVPVLECTCLPAVTNNAHMHVMHMHVIT